MRVKYKYIQGTAIGKFLEKVRNILAKTLIVDSWRVEMLKMKLLHKS